MTEASLEISIHKKILPVADFVQIMVLKMLEQLQNVERLTFGSTLLQVLCVFHYCIVYLRAKTVCLTY